MFKNVKLYAAYGIIKTLSFFADPNYMTVEVDKLPPIESPKPF